MYTPSPSTFYCPIFPFIESRLDVNYKTIIFLKRGLRLSWILFCLPIHIISVLLYKFTSAPVPDFLVQASVKHKNWNLYQSLFYPIITRLLYAIASTGLPPSTDSRVVPLSSKIVSYFDEVKIDVRQEDIRLPKDLSNWFRDEAVDFRGVVVPMEVNSFWLEAKKGEMDLKDLEIKIGALPSRKKYGERVILYLVGGGYIVGGGIGSPLMGTRCYNLASESGLKILAINYRKAIDSAHAFPAALQDTIVAYSHLLSLGYRDIVLAGDSAGGGLCINLLMYLNQISINNPPTSLVLPSALLLYSPWLDLTLSTYSQDACDFINPTMMANSRDMYLINIASLEVPMSPSHPFLSPALRSSLPALQLLSKSYGGEKKPLHVLMISGSGEAIASEIRGFARNLKEVAGIKLDWIEEKDELHVFFLAPHFISPASKRALESAGRFLRR